MKTPKEILNFLHANNKGAYKPALMRGVVSAFVLRSLKCMIDNFDLYNSFNNLAGLCSWACWIEPSTVMPTKSDIDLMFC